MAVNSGGEIPQKEVYFLLNKHLIKNVQGEFAYSVPGRLFHPPCILDAQEYVRSK